MKRYHKKNILQFGKNRAGGDLYQKIIADSSEAGDANGDGEVNFGDIEHLQSALGLCAGDTNGDGTVDGNDLTIVLGAWGLTCDK